MKYHEAVKIYAEIEKYLVETGQETPGAYDEYASQIPGGYEAKIALKATIPVNIGPVRVVNCTPHEIRFQNGDALIEVPPSGITLKADATEELHGELPGVQFVKTVFDPSAEGQADLDALISRYPHNDVLFVASIISAQAFNNERVVGMVSVEGFERVPPAEKRFRNDKFTVFTGESVVRGGGFAAKPFEGGIHIIDEYGADPDGYKRDVLVAVVSDRLEPQRRGMIVWSKEYTDFDRQVRHFWKQES